MTTIQEKSLPLAIGLNILLPGAGYMYMGRVIIGLAAMVLIVLMFVSAGVLFVVPTWLSVNAIMAIDMWILFNKNKALVLAATSRKCPHCAETIQQAARVCKHCQRDVSSSTTTDDFEQWQQRNAK